MILGMSTHTFTLLGVAVSLLTIVSGGAVLRGLLANRLYRLWNTLFLLTASLTSVDGGVVRAIL